MASAVGRDCEPLAVWEGTAVGEESAGPEGCVAMMSPAKRVATGICTHSRMARGSLFTRGLRRGIGLGSRTGVDCNERDLCTGGGLSGLLQALRGPEAARG